MHGALRYPGNPISRHAVTCAKYSDLSRRLKYAAVACRKTAWPKNESSSGKSVLSKFVYLTRECQRWIANDAVDRAFTSPVYSGAAAGRRLAQQIVTRMLANAPPTKQETRKLYQLCWQLAPLRTAIQWARQRTALAKIRSGR
jgi:hypothetical protein